MSNGQIGNLVGDHIPLKQGLRHCLSNRSVCTYCVGDHIPLKQGLRQIALSDNISSSMGRRPYSIKTRIKTRHQPYIALPFSVGDHIPLKQGLRQVNSEFCLIFSIVGDHIPLKQGLRPRRA